MYNPISTYRIQFHKDFPLSDLEKQIEYLSLLGVGSIYASPLFAAISGSGHGYDVVDPLNFNPEVTDAETFLAVRERLMQHNIGWLQDIVPNHMAFHPANHWLMDVLEKGQKSEYATFFDFEPGVPAQDKKLMVPFLGCSLEEAIQNKEIKLGWHEGSFTIEHFDNVYPASHESVRMILDNDIIDAPQLFEDVWDNYLRFSSEKEYLNGFWKEGKKKAQYIYSIDKETVRFIDNLLITWSSHEHLMRKVLEKQHYELCHWQETEKRINFRRFFTINGLICLRMEDPEVFSKYHSLIADMVQQGHFNGLRIDHIDGLNDPNAYLTALRGLCGEKTYIVAEKILEHNEDLPTFWPIQGNTGYDFLAMVNNLLTSVENYDKLKSLYKEVTTVKSSPAELIYQNKRMILTTHMHGEWNNIFGYFNSLGFMDFDKDEISSEEIKEAIGEFMLACPVYRLYPRVFPLRNENRRLVEGIFEKARNRNPALKPALEKLAGIILAEKTDDEFNARLSSFFARLMQFTGPLMAKGVEDTSMYQYNCFIAHNEVGDAMNAGGITTEQFHKEMLYRQQHWPLTMNTTSTHDTKRGEDVRARLNVISEFAGEWKELVHQWMQMNQKLKVRLESGLLEPSLSVEYFIYQTLIGTFPFDGKATKVYQQRIDEYLVKALREAKRKVSWSDPDETYENTVIEFTHRILDPGHSFLEAFVRFQQKIAWRGIVNSLTQTTLKIACPGVPDIYQGTELWDLTLVDPDNRQPVDYDQRLNLLQGQLQQYRKDSRRMMTELTENADNGAIKMWYTHCLLKIRKDHPGLFLSGSYIPLTITGKYKDHLLAFARNTGSQWMLAAVPLITASLTGHTGAAYLQQMDWEDTAIILPGQLPPAWHNIITGSKVQATGTLPAEKLLYGKLPAVVMGSE